MNFATEDADGVEYVSYAGGTHIFIKGQNLGEDASQVLVTLTTTALSSTGASQTFVAPRLTEEDVFNSQPLLGAISYRLPSLHVLVGSPTFDLYHYS